MHVRCHALDTHGRDHRGRVRDDDPTMAAYLVADATDDTMILVDSVGRRHLARALHGTPPAGVELHGPRPSPGFALLSQGSTQRLCRVIFEQVDVERGA